MQKKTFFLSDGKPTFWYRLTFLAHLHLGVYGAISSILYGCFLFSYFQKTYTTKITITIITTTLLLLFLSFVSGYLSMHMLCLLYGIMGTFLFIFRNFFRISLHLLLLLPPPLLLLLYFHYYYFHYYSCTAISLCLFFFFMISAFHMCVCCIVTTLLFMFCYSGTPFRSLKKKTFFTSTCLSSLYSLPVATSVFFLSFHSFP